MAVSQKIMDLQKPPLFIHFSRKPVDVGGPVHPHVVLFLILFGGCDPSWCSTLLIPLLFGTLDLQPVAMDGHFHYCLP